MIKRTHKMLIASVIIAMLTASCSVPNQETKENLTPRVTTYFTSTLTTTTKVSEKVNTTIATTTSATTTAESTTVVTEVESIVTEMTTLRETEEHYSPVIIVTEPVVIETQSVTTTEICTETTTEEPVTEVVRCNLSDSEYTLLCQLIANEAGFASLIERAKIVGAVMNGCKRWNKTVTEFIYSACVPYGFKPGKEYYYDTVRASDMADAVDYYLVNGEAGFYDTGWWEYGADSWSGCHSDHLNHFYRA